jgi:quinol monooxygenase YgiN
MDQQLIVVAEMKAKAGQQAELRRQTLALVEPTRREKGCVRYDLHECGADPGRFLFYEVWASNAAWQTHMKKPHLARFLAQLDEWLGEPARVMTYAQIA